MSAPPASSGWARAMSELADVGDRVAEQLRARGHADAEVDASVTLLGALVFHYLNQVCADPDHPSFVPGPGYDTRIGTPNPDTTYRYAAVDGSGTYLLAGDRGTTPDVTIMPFGPATATGQRSFPPFDLSELHVDRDGRFDVLLAPRRPTGHTGDWWELDAEVRSLMLRCTSDDWGTHRDPSVAIVRLDTDPRRRRRTGSDVARQLAAMATSVERMVTYGLRRVDELRASEGTNRLALVGYGARGGLAGQWYHEGAFELAPDEALVVEVDGLPPESRFSVSLTDPLFCTVDWTYAQSSLNRRQATLDDGALRFLVAHDDPGVPNWLDTTGYTSGVLQCRWTDVDTPPRATARVTTFEAVRAEPPTLNRSQRTAGAHRRAIGAQLRELW